MSLKLDASENCRNNAEFLEFEMDFEDSLGFTNLEDTQDDEGWCDGGSLLGRESLESFLHSPFVQV